MKFRTIMRHLREGIKNIGRNGWMTVASIGAVTTTLILVGVFLALVLNLNQMANNIEDDVEISAFIDPTINEEEATTLGDDIKKIDGVDSVVFSSKDEQLEQLIDSMGDEGQSWQLFEQDNPLNHAYVVNAVNPDETMRIAEEITDLQGVQEVEYGQDVVQRLFEFNQYARTIGLVLILGLVFTAIFLISNTIKITIMARSTEIGIQKLVGATNGFIRWPFFVEGLLLGVLGSIIPIAAILAGYYYIDTNVSGQINYGFVEFLPFYPFAWQLSLIILGIGALIGVWGSVMSVRKFLKV
ncbi:permease-like cell division protein FtsX [Virgibacillus sp. NKC19-3]|uniref:permease-like cell division protein FtsX n=1 Tax=Virgibacillus saliphilus TaxID=2831674 RepID=UPI001C9B77C6|nr:permease-like cell division protein FtsX [Virgibacillus sp. NKC19-3]MBY7144109.1 permease-like cell division protein FtsX [Virgibacillus sp. NKC19-3]